MSFCSVRSSFLWLATLAACGGGQREVAVKGPDNELVKLVGTWEGDYHGDDSGRSGPISFGLQLGQHSAEGEVRMGGTTPLKIDFVQIKAGQIRGTIAPYTDPGCSCQVETTFLGTRAGESISGMFETKVGATGQIQTGSWKVARTAR
ncbi:MAG: hypothetical protein H7138_13600 [Myxococcales bacterium]|nr:hypothetical protein [Myxococcales bacterium]